MKRSLRKLAAITSVMILLSASLNAQTYCAASGGCDEHISNVTVGTINNSSGCSAGYQDYTTMSTLMLPGQSYPITVTNGNPYSSDQCGIWVDWNQNGNFLDDAPITVVGTPGGGPYTATITVPGTALPGSTRMRVRILYTGTVDPCGSTTYGEVEDYTITIPSSNPVDAGITAITQPTSPTQPGLKPVSVVLMNYGTAALTSVTLNYSVNGVLATPYLWTGNLASFASSTVQVGTENLGLGTHVIKAWSSMPNGQVDSSNMNDTATISVVVTNVLTYTLGTGTITNTTTSYPSAYGQYYTGERAQYLLLASELTAIGASGGNILSLAFDVVTPTTATALGANLNGFNIRMGTTTATSLSTWLPTTTQLYTVSQYVTTVGWNTHTFTTPFFWDGVSNLVIETCFDNYVTQYDYTTNAVVRQTATPFSSVLNFRSDVGGVCSSTTVSGTYTQRPNMRLTFAPNLPNDAGIAAITSPSSPLLPGNANMKVNLRNYGTSPLTSVTIGWSVNGVAQTAYSWTGNLLSSTVDTGIVLGNYTFPLGIHTVKAWTSMPNNVVDSAEFNDTATITLIVCNLLTGTYTVGGTTADYPDIQTAVNAAAACGVAGPVTFNILPGTYNQQLTIPVIPGSSGLNTVTLQSSTGIASDVVIQYAAASGADNWVVRLNGADYITLQNMTIRTASQTGTYGHVIELINGADFNTIAGNIIVSMPTVTASTASGIFSSGTKDEFNMIAGNTITGGYYGIYLYGPTATRELGNLIVGNTIQDFHYYGIYSGYQDAPVISENIVISRASTSTVAYGIYGYYNNNASIVTKNRINARATSSNYALYMYYCNGTTTDRGLVANNFISQSLTAGPTAIYGLYNYYTTFFDFYHNSVNVMANYASGYAWYHTGSTAASCEYINNMFVNMGGGYAAYVPASSLAGITAMDYNNYYSSGTNLAFMGSAQTTLAGIQNATLMNYNSISANPLFYTPTALYPSSISVNNLGVPIAIVPDDIDGNLRHVLTPDMGAVEFEPPQNDAGISAINSPGSPIGPGSQMISATIKNYGLIDLLTATVHWNINGGPVSSQLWTGLVSPGQESAPANLGSYTFPYGQHVLKVWTSGPNGSNDPNAMNDTMTKIIVVCDIMVGTYTIGATGADYPSIAAALSDLNNCGVGGAVTFNIFPGTYTGQVTIGEIPGTSATNTVTFQSSTGIAADVTIQYAPVGTADNWVIRLNGSDYVTLQFMTIKTATGTGTYGYVIELTNGANYNTINGNVIESVPGTTSSSTACIFSGTSTDEYNIITNNTMRYGYASVNISGPSTAATENGNIIADNVMENYYYYGGNILYQRNVIISGNTVTSAANSGVVYGFRPYYCYDAVVITKNNITITGSSTNYGIYAYVNTGTAMDPGLMANNIINQMSTSTGTVYTLYFYNANYMRVYHNTIRARSTSTSNYGVYVSSLNNNMEMVNNMFVNEGNGYTIYGTVANLQVMTACNYNNIYATGSTLAYAGAAVANLAAWQTATGLDANSVSANPAFIMPNNLTPSSGAVNNLGTPLAVVPDDINGVLRNILTPDMGAIEFDPIAYEAAHLGFTQPTGGCDLGIEPVSILIKNQGGMDIMGGLTASYQVIGSTTVTTENITAFIPSNTTYTYTFASSVNLSVTSDSTFTLKSWISLTGDPVPGNDTASYTVRSMVSPPPPQVANVNIPYGQSATLTVINPDTAYMYYWYNVPVGGTFLAIDTSFTTPLLYNTTVYYVEATGGFGSGSLLTTMVSGNGLAGCMFNLTSVNPVTIDSFYLNTGSSGTIEVYYKQGTYVGFEQNASAWTQAGTTSVVGAGVGNNTLVNIGGIQMLPGQTYGIYITFVSGTQQYTNGNGSNEFYTDGNLSLQAGAGVSYLFGTSVFTPRVFNGTVHYSSGNGCASLRVADTVFVSAPIVTVNLGADKSICQGDTTQLNAVVSGGVAPYTYAWSPAISLNNASIPNPLAFPQVNTTYSVTVSDQNADSGTDDIIVTVKPKPNVVFPALPSVYDNTPPFPLTGGTPAGGTYSGPGVTGGIFNPAVAGVGSHTITYTYTDPVSGCTGSATSVQQVALWIGIGEVAAGQGFAIWPNPSAGMVMLTVKAKDASMQLEVLDVQGKVVMDRRLINASGRHELDLTALPQGVYHIRLTGGTETYLQKLILH